MWATSNRARPVPDSASQSHPGGPPVSLKFQRPKLRSRICESLNPIVINKWYRSRLDKRECAAMLRAVK